MTETKDYLREFVETGSESAFRELVNRYVNLVYSTAIRRTGGNRDLAEDIVQKVFTDLAMKAATLKPDVLLGGWLHRHSCFVASNAVRSESRRQAREKQAVFMSSLNQPDPAWAQLSPIIDEAIDQLEMADRTAITLRFFREEDLRAVGREFGISEDAAQKRVSRALEKLKDLLEARGVALSASGLATLLAANLVEAAPAELGASVASTALRSQGHALAPVGLAALSFSFLLKLGLLCGALLVPAFLIKEYISRPKSLTSVSQQNLATRGPEQGSVAGRSTNDASKVAPPSPSAARAQRRPSETKTLELLLLAADSGKPVPNVAVRFRGWEDRQFIRKDLIASRDGRCEVPFSADLTRLELKTEIDGFADTKLEWFPNRGGAVPEAYTIRLVRAVLIGGTVVDASGKPVQGAKIGFNSSMNLRDTGQVETHDFGWIETISEESGKWTIHRVSSDAIRSMYGAARHSEYVDSPMVYVGKDPAAEQALRANSHVFKLEQGLILRGIVTSQDNEPLAGARILVGHVGSSSARKAEADLDGTFIVRGCPKEETMVTAEADGYSAGTRKVTIVPEMEPVQLILGRGKLFRMKLVNKAAQPIAGANVWMDTFDHSAGADPIPQTEFAPKTDEMGLVIWTNAPDRELKFDFSAKGYMRKSAYRLRPDGKEHIITMDPSLRISGTVRDATTLEPMPAFKVITGWPDGRTNAQWSTIDRYWLAFSGGKFDHTYEEPALYGMSPIQFMFRFEAEGFRSHVSRVVNASEGAATFDVLLQPAASNLLTVLEPDGRPASRATVALVDGASRFRLGRSGFSDRTGALIRETGQDGTFVWTDEPNVHAVLVASPKGFVEVPARQLKEGQTIRLQRWGVLEGNYSVNGKPRADIELNVQFAEHPKSNISFDWQTYKTSTDERGNFRIEQLPPGKLRLVRLVPEKVVTGPPQAWSHAPEETFTVEPGQTAVLNLDYHAARIRVQPNWPPGLASVAMEKANVVLFNLFVPPPADPLERQRWSELPETQARMAEQRSAPARLQNDGTWLADMVRGNDLVVVISFPAASQDGPTAMGHAPIRLAGERELSGAVTVDLSPLSPLNRQANAR